MEERRDGLTTKEEIDHMYELLEKEAERFEKGSASGALKKVWKVFYNVLFIVIMFLAVYSAIQVLIANRENRTPVVFGYSFYNVLSESMEPTYNVGAILVGKQVDDPENIAEGTVIVFNDFSGAKVVHRIVAVRTSETGVRFYNTKGDNPNNVVDEEPVTPDRIEAEIVWKLPFSI